MAVESIKFKRGGGVEQGVASPHVIEKLASHKAQEIVGETRVSSARQRIEEYRKAAQVPAILKVADAQGGEWFVRTLSLPLHHEIALRVPRDHSGKLDLSGGAKYSQFLAAVIFASLVKSETDLTPYFDQNELGWEEACIQADESGPMYAANSVIVNTSLILNPDILPEATARLRAQLEAHEENDTPPLPQGQDSMKSSGTTPLDGLNPTPPTPQEST